MAALPFLDPPLIVKDSVTPSVSHEIELFESDGQLFIRLWIAGIAADMPVICNLTKKQAAQLSDAAECLSLRLPD